MRACVQVGGQGRAGSQATGAGNAIHFFEGSSFVWVWVYWRRQPGNAASHQASQQKQPTRPRQLRNVEQCSRPESTSIPAPPPPKGVASTQHLQDFDRWGWPLLLASTSPRPRPCQRIAEGRSCPPAIRERRETRHESGLGIPTGLPLRMMRSAHNARPPCRRP